MDEYDNQSLAYSEASTSYYEPSAGTVLSCDDDKKTIKTTLSEKQRRENRSSVYTIKRKINGKMKKINLFNTTTTANSPIVNAITGFPFGSIGEKKYLVGSSMQDDLFKVRFLTRENGIPGLTLFYETPEHYERHTNSIVDPEIKKKCYERKKLFELRMQKYMT